MDRPQNRLLARQNRKTASQKDAQEMIQQQFPWDQPTSIFGNDGPDEDVEFEISGVSLKVETTDALAPSTFRDRYKVTCVTCNEILHEATTSATIRCEDHLREAHGLG